MWCLPCPRGSRHLVITEFGLKDHDCCGFWDLIPQLCLIVFYNVATARSVSSYHSLRKHTAQYDEATLNEALVSEASGFPFTLSRPGWALKPRRRPGSPVIETAYGSVLASYNINYKGTPILK